MKQTYNPSNLKRKRTHGFRARMATKSGRLVIKARRAKGRKKLSAQQNHTQLFEILRLSNNLSKQNRLLKQHEYQRVFSTPVRISDSSLLLLARANDDKIARLGLAISKKRIKSSVDRNLVKRLIRESFRLNKDKIVGWDVVIITHRNMDKINKQRITKSINNHWRALQKCKL